jgi:hypothetical protein
MTQLPIAHIIHCKPWVFIITSVSRRATEITSSEILESTKRVEIDCVEIGASWEKASEWKIMCP